MAYVRIGCGFASEPTLHCSDRDMREVGESDGCTFGVQGEHGYLRADVDVDVSQCVAVGGYAEF